LTRKNISDLQYTVGLKFKLWDIPTFWCWITQVVLEKRPLHGCHNG